MKFTTIILFFIFLLYMSSCSTIQTDSDNNNSNQENNTQNDSTKTNEDEEILDGYWSDQIGLSQDSIIFKAKEDSITINTKNSTWWLEGFNFYKTSDLSSKYDYYTCTLEEIEKSQTNGIEIKYKWFTVYCSSKDKIIKIKVDQNNTSQTRYWSITLQGGDYFGHIYCKQIPINPNN